MTEVKRLNLPPNCSKSALFCVWNKCGALVRSHTEDKGGASLLKQLCFLTGRYSSVEETWLQSPVLSAAKVSRAPTKPTADAPGASPWVTSRRPNAELAPPGCDSLSSICFPGPRGKSGHPQLPPFWPGGRLTVPLRLSGCVQRPLCCGEEARPFLWNLPARESHFLLQRHDAGDGDGWGDAELRICGLFQSNPTLWLDYTLTLQKASHFSEGKTLKLSLTLIKWYFGRTEKGRVYLFFSRRTSVLEIWTVDLLTP